MAGLLAGRRVVVVDTETTGLDPHAGHALVEVAAVPVVDGALGEPWSSLVDPGRPIPPDATQVHGITDLAVLGAPRPAEAVRRLLDCCGGDPLVFYNAEFDLPFLLEAMRGQGIAPPLNLVLDVLGLARGLFGMGGNRLGQLAARLGVALEGSHRALGDALTTARVFLALVPLYESQRGVRTLTELAMIGRDVMRATRR